MKQFQRIQLVIICLFVAFCTNAQERYTYKGGDVNGIRKWYMGRQIAQVMSHYGIEWLERPERDFEENTIALLKNLNLKPGMKVADIGAGSGYHSRLIAKEIGKTDFIQLDDDYSSFEFRYLSRDGQKLLVKKISNLDKVLDLYLDFYKKTQFKSIAFAQGGDFIGGAENVYAQKNPLMRKCMNSFMCSTERQFQFVGAMNEDVNTYTTLGSRGNLFGTMPIISLVQAATQSQKSGITDMYLRYGTYCKAFTTVMMQPSSVKISMMRSSNPRIHHSIRWQNTTPMILDEKHKKNNLKLPLASNLTQSSLHIQ